LKKKGIYFFILIVVLFPSSFCLGAASRGAGFQLFKLKYAGQEILPVDFNGDNLEDIIIVDEPNLLFFFQREGDGFGEEADLVYSLGDKPAIFWAAQVGEEPGECILVMTHNGVSKVRYKPGDREPVWKRLIERSTLVPEECEELNMVYFRLSADTGDGYPLIILPREGRLEIWKYDDGWVHDHSIEKGLRRSVYGPYKGTGYTEQFRLDMNIDDIDGDRRKDLVICEHEKGTVTFNVYPQREGDVFSLKPACAYKDEWDWRTWGGVVDINKDGRADFIKGRWLEEPWFIPGTLSGKVIIRVFITGSDGSVPEEPQYVFRKSDWNSSIPIVDIDGDGYVDMVLGYTLIRGREDIRKSLSSRKMDHSLRFHFYNGQRYSLKPDCQRDVTIDVGGPEIHLTWSRRHYLQTHICLEGDFNGDGKLDLLVKDRRKEASVYLFSSREEGFSNKAWQRFGDIGEVKRFIPRDLNRDGLSDLIVIDDDKNHLKVFLSRLK